MIITWIKKMILVFFAIFLFLFIATDIIVHIFRKKKSKPLQEKIQTTQ